VILKLCVSKYSDIIHAKHGDTDSMAILSNYFGWTFDQKRRWMDFTMYTVAFFIGSENG
jgi:hypothetical protein